jgi:hypothetical protein
MSIRHIWIMTALLTITLNHKGFYYIMADHLKVRVTNPVTYSRLRAGEEVVKDGDFVAKDHETVHKVGANKASTTGNQDAFALGRRKELDRRESRECGIRD